MNFLPLVSLPSTEESRRTREKKNSCTQGKNVNFSTCLRWPVYFIFIPFISLVDKIIFLYFTPRSKQHQSFLKNLPFFNHRFSPIYCNGWIPVLWPSCPLTQDFPRWSRKKSSFWLSTSTSSRSLKTQKRAWPINGYHITCISCGHLTLFPNCG